MTVLTEGNLEITINGKANARKFDDASHGLSHCMKSVDFIVELPDRYMFIEVKDPQAPQATGKARDKFFQKFQSGQIDEELKYKYRDSFLYEWASKRVDKPVDYLVLIALDDALQPLLLTRKDALERKLPLRGPKSRLWPRPIVRGCGVFNITSWNRHFPEYPVRRLPAHGN